jgi:hypothetical protein
VEGRKEQKAREKGDQCARTAGDSGRNRNLNNNDGGNQPNTIGFRLQEVPKDIQGRKGMAGTGRGQVVFRGVEVSDLQDGKGMSTTVDAQKGQSSWRYAMCFLPHAGTHTPGHMQMIRTGGEEQNSSVVLKRRAQGQST